MRAECVPCLLKRTVYEASLVHSCAKRMGIRGIASGNSEVNEGAAERAVQAALKIVAKEYSSNANSISVATKVHREVYRLLGNDDPYKELKKRSNKTALALLPKVERIIQSSTDSLRSAALCSIIGNVLDFGISSSYSAPEALIEDFEALYNKGLGVNDIGKAEKYLKPHNKILFFTDNCGEIVFDKLLCRELKKFKIHLTVVVKDKPILTDATIEDAKQLKFTEVADSILASTNAVGIDFNEISTELKDRIEGADLLICKGMGLYEGFCETNYKPILYLLRTKCAPVAEDMGVEKDINAARLYE